MELIQLVLLCMLRVSCMDGELQSGLMILVSLCVFVWRGHIMLKVSKSRYGTVGKSFQTVQEGITKMFLPSLSLPVMGETAGVSTALLGGYLHSWKTRANWVERFHDEFNGHVFNLERDGFRQVVSAHDSPYDEIKQPYHTKLVAAQVNKDCAFHRTPRQRCQACYSCIMEDSGKRQHHH